MTLEWREANAEEMPFADRVCKPGGRIGVISWTPEGFIGQMFATMKPYVPAPPPGVQPPPLWANEDHVRALLGDRVEQFTARRDVLAELGDRYLAGSSTMPWEYLLVTARKR